MYRRCDRLWEELTLGSVIFQSVFFIFRKPESRQYKFITDDYRCGKAKHSFEYSPVVLLCQYAWVMRRESVLTMDERWSCSFGCR